MSFSPPVDSCNGSMPSRIQQNALLTQAGRELFGFGVNGRSGLDLDVEESQDFGEERIGRRVAVDARTLAVEGPSENGRFLEKEEAPAATNITRLRERALSDRRRVRLLLYRWRSKSGDQSNLVSILNLFVP